ncbi:hypothetical protein J6590_027790 [Homalodisca vitripennis]|nr:hypothetical protein J6590_027790 [Homalodisca vitripennis]
MVRRRQAIRRTIQFMFYYVNIDTLHPTEIEDKRIADINECFDKEIKKCNPIQQDSKKTSTFATELKQSYQLSIDFL